MRATCSAHPLLLDLITLIIMEEEQIMKLLAVIFSFPYCMSLTFKCFKYLYRTKCIVLKLPQRMSFTPPRTLDKIAVIHNIIFRFRRARGR